MGREEDVEDQADEHDGEDEQSALIALGVVCGLRVHNEALERGRGEVASGRSEGLPGYHRLPVENRE